MSDVIARSTPKPVPSSLLISPVIKLPEERKAKCLSLRQIRKYYMQCECVSSETPSTTNICDSISLVDDSRVQHELRATIATITQSCPSLKQSTESSLLAFLKSSAVQCPYHTPVESFAKKQVCLTAQEILFRLQLDDFCCLDMKDEVNNILALYDYLVACGEGNAAGQLHNLITELITIIEPLAIYFEKLEKPNRRILDWGTLRAKLSTGNQMRIEDPQEPIVLNLKHLQLENGHLLYQTQAANYFRTTFAANIPCIIKVSPLWMNNQPPEAQNIASAMLRHHLIQQTYLFFSTPSAYVYMMEYTDGVTLCDVTRELGSASVNMLRLILIQLSIAVRHLHKLGLIHRDIRACGIKIEQNLQIKVHSSDAFKICSSKFQSGASRQDTRRYYQEFAVDDTAPICPLNYCPPECVTPRQPYGKAVDWWQVGIIAFYLFTGTLPFAKKTDGTSKCDVLQHIKSEEPQWRTLIEDLHTRSLIECLLVKRPRDRLPVKSYSTYTRHQFFAAINFNIVEAQGIGIVNCPSAKTDIDHVFDKMRTNSQSRSNRMQPSNQSLTELRNADILTMYVQKKMKAALKAVEDGASVKVEDLLEVTQRVVESRISERISVVSKTKSTSPGAFEKAQQTCNKS